MCLTLSMRVSINFSQTALTPDAKQSLYLSVNVFSTKILIIRDTTFMSPPGDRTTTLCGHPSHTKVQPFAGHRQYLRFISQVFQTLSYGTAPKIEPATSGSTVQSSALPTELILLWSLSTLFHTHPFIQNCPLNKLGPGKSKRYITSALSHTALPHCHNTLSQHNRKKVSLEKSFHIQADL